MWLICDNDVYNGCTEIIDLNTQFSLFISDDYYSVGIVTFTGDEYIVADHHESYNEALEFVSKLIKLSYDSECDTVISVKELEYKFGEYT